MFREMRIPGWFLVCCFIGIRTVSGAASKKASDATQQDKLDQMTQLSHVRSVIRLDTDKFKKLVKTSQKPYNVLVMLTALKSDRGCSMCKAASDEFSIVANSWHYLSTQQPETLFFAMADFDDAPEVFQMLSIQHVPKYMLFPANGRPTQADVHDLQRRGYEAEDVAKFVSERTGLSIRVFRPPNYSGTLFVAFLVLSGAILLYVRRSTFDFLWSRNTWALIVAVVILTMISGQMWNSIRSPPFVHRGNDGNVGYFSGSTQFQFIAETYIVFGLYAACSIGFIILSNVKVWKSSVICSISGIIIFSLFFSYILSQFRAKYGGYPYSFMFK